MFTLFITGIATLLISLGAASVTMNATLWLVSQAKGHSLPARAPGLVGIETVTNVIAFPVFSARIPLAA